LPGSRHKCPSCNWGIVSEYWNYCAWCCEPVEK
jgi:hypothetical protein